MAIETMMAFVEMPGEEGQAAYSATPKWIDWFLARVLGEVAPGEQPARETLGRIALLAKKGGSENRALAKRLAEDLLRRMPCDLVDPPDPTQ